VSIKVDWGDVDEIYTQSRDAVLAGVAMIVGFSRELFAFIHVEVSE